jgi:hypothetical protein
MLLFLTMACGQLFVSLHGILALDTGGGYVYLLPHPPTRSCMYEHFCLQETDMGMDIHVLMSEANRRLSHITWCSSRVEEVCSLCSLALPAGHACTHIILCPCKKDVGSGFYNANFNFKILWIIMGVYYCRQKIPSECKEV